MKRNAKNWLSRLLSFTLVLGLTLTLGLATLAEGGNVTTEEDLRDALSAGGEATVTLGADITTTGELTVVGTKTLDLNGFGITANPTEEDSFSVLIIKTSAGTLNLIDNGNTEHYYFLDESGLAHVVDSAEDEDYVGAEEGKKGSFTGGYLTGGSGSPFTANGVVYYLGGGVQNYGTFNMSGGTILGNATDNGGGVCTLMSGKFTMSGGAILGNTAIDFGGGGVFLYDVGGLGCKFTMNGGTISYNRAFGDPDNELDEVFGGGVYNFGSTIEMNDGTISHNWSTTGGGGVENYNSGKFTMSGGTIEYNQSRYGGGVENTYASTFTMSGGTISYNTTTNSTDNAGGGVANYYNSTFTMSGGAIEHNLSSYGGGVENGTGYNGDNSTFTMSGGSISYNTADPQTGGAGGGVENHSATFVMSEQAVISHNVAKNGGGVESYFNSKFTMSGGSISNNQASVRGGGVENYSGKFTMSGGTIEHNKGNNGGGVINNKLAAASYACTFTMSGGTIQQNESKYNGGGVTNSGGVFNMSKEAAIIGNTAASNGGGVYVVSSGTLVMNGGAISGNTAASNGGGVYVVSSGTLVMYGGTISGNTAGNGNEGSGNGGGVYVFSGGEMMVSDDASVVGNTNQSGEANNVCLSNGRLISVTDALTPYDSATSSGACIGITMQTPGVFTSGLKANDPSAALGAANNFFCDNHEYVISVNSEGDAMLSHGYLVSGSFDDNGKVVASFDAPKDSLLIVTAYDKSGKRVDAKSFAITKATDGEWHTFTDLKTGTGYYYSLMLVDASTYAPLCPAWRLLSH